MYLTHYSRIGDVPRAAAHLLGVLNAMVALAERSHSAPDRHAALVRELTALYVASLAAHGVERAHDKIALLALDIELNAQGLGIWLDREAKKAGA